MMIWTHEPPTEPGFYWVRAQGNGSYSPRVVEVFRGDEHAPLYVACPRAPQRGPLTNWTRLPDLQWARVPPPSEAADPYRSEAPV